MRRTLALLRFGDWTHLLCLPLLTVPLRPVLPGRLGLALLAAAAYLAFAYGYNELQDRGWGALEPAELRARTGLSPSSLRLLWGGLWALCLGLTAPMAWWVAAVAAVGLVGSALYSGGPRLKRFPVIGTTTNLWIFVPLLFFGGAVPAGRAFGWLVAAFCTLLVQSQLIHEASHRRQDAKEGIRTTAVVFGPRATKLLSVVMGLGASASLTALATRAPFVPSLLAAAGVGLFTVVSAVTVDFGSTRAAHRLRLLHRYVSVAAGGIAWLAVVW